MRVVPPLPAGYDAPLIEQGWRAMRVRVKICGITSLGDAQLAAAAGVDAVGMVFCTGSPRAVDVQVARDIVAAVGPFICTVALFVNPTRSEVEDVISGVKPDLLQFHGDEPQQFCEGFGVPYIKVLKVGSSRVDAALLASHPAARGLLLDTLDPQRHGGTGRRFDWSLAPAGSGRPIVLAGGLDADNVEEGIRSVRPWAVDVSSGVESSPGQKDPVKVGRFMRAVERANVALQGPSSGADIE